MWEQPPLAFYRLLPRSSLAGFARFLGGGLDLCELDLGALSFLAGAGVDGPRASFGDMAGA